MSEKDNTPANLAGAEIVKGADDNMPEEEKPTCIHMFIIEKIILKRSNLFTEEELLAAIIYCKNCGRLGGSSRIKF